MSWFTRSCTFFSDSGDATVIRNPTAELGSSSPINAVSNRFAPTRNLGHTARFLFAFYGLAIVWGIRSISIRRSSLLDVLLPITLAICLGLWTIADARCRKHVIPLLSKPWFFLLALPIVPGLPVGAAIGEVSAGLCFTAFAGSCWPQSSCRLEAFLSFVKNGSKRQVCDIAIRNGLRRQVFVRE